MGGEIWAVKFGREIWAVDLVGSLEAARVFFYLQEELDRRVGILEVGKLLLERRAVLRVLPQPHLTRGR